MHPSVCSSACEELGELSLDDVAAQIASAAQSSGQRTARLDRPQLLRMSSSMVRQHGGSVVRAVYLTRLLSSAV